MPTVMQRDRVILSRPIEPIGPGITERPASTGRFRSAEDQLTEAIATQGPLWLELDLESDPTRWLDPWQDMDRQVDWHPLEETAQTFRLSLPTDGPRGSSLEETVLRRLPYINELGQLRWLYQELKDKGAGQVIALPLIGFSPIGGYECDSRAGVLEFILLRVNVAVLDPYLITLRLPDRLCSGVRLLEKGPSPDDHRPRRFAARDHCAKLPKLDHFKRYLPQENMSAKDAGMALALYLSATCDCVAEHARGRLVEVEMSLETREPSPSEGEPVDAVAESQKDLERLADVSAKQREILEARGTLQVVDEELGRLLQRQREVEGADVEFLCDARSRYSHALDSVRAVEQDLRAASDALSTRASTLQARSLARQEREAKERAEHTKQLERLIAERNKRRERVIAILGTVLVFATLVASLSNDSSKLPHPKSAREFFGMLMVMFGLAGLALCGLSAYVTRNEPERKRLARAFWAALVGATALSVAGVVQWVS